MTTIYQLLVIIYRSLGGTDRLINPSMRCLTLRENDVTKLNRLWVCPRFEPPTPHLCIWSEWRLTVIAATVRIALVDILDLSEVDIPAGGFLYPAVGWG